MRFQFKIMFTLAAYVIIQFNMAELDPNRNTCYIDKVPVSFHCLLSVRKRPNVIDLFTSIKSPCLKEYSFNFLRRQVLGICNLFLRPWVPFDSMPAFYNDGTDLNVHF